VPIDALAHLRYAHSYLTAAMADTQRATEHLGDARKSRADELAELIGEAIHHCLRLATVVEDDVLYARSACDMHAERKPVRTNSFTPVRTSKTSS
jgi:hypothetical protein